MKCKLYIFAVLLLFITSCKNSNNQNVNKVQESDSILIAPQVAKVDRDSLIIDDFKAMFLEECKKWPVNFYIDTLDRRQPWFDNLNLSGHKDLKGFRYLLFVDKTINQMSVAIAAFRFSDVEKAQSVIDIHCKEFHNAMKKGEESYFYEVVYAKMPYNAIRIDSTIFEVSATNSVGHIMRNTVDKFIKKYAVIQDNIIPCERNS